MSGSAIDPSEAGDLDADDGDGDGFGDRFREIDEHLPALSALTEQQTEVVRSFLDGFETRADAIRWAQRASIYTLGELDASTFASSLGSRLDLAALCTDFRRDADLDAKTAKRIRTAVASSEIVPPSVAAARRMRAMAAHHPADADGPDGTGQAHPGMRPLLTEIHERQRWALDALLSGFDSEDEFIRWSAYVAEASHVEIDEGLAERILSDEPASLTLLMESSPTARVFREDVAINRLLDAFGAGASEAVGSASEMNEQRNDEIDFGNIA